jgi:hypothetical protein
MDARARTPHLLEKAQRGMGPWLSGYSSTMRNVRDGVRDGEDVARDELWRDLWWSAALIGVVATALSLIGWLAL